MHVYVHVYMRVGMYGSMCVRVTDLCVCVCEHVCTLPHGPPLHSPAPPASPAQLPEAAATL